MAAPELAVSFCQNVSPMEESVRGIGHFKIATLSRLSGTGTSAKFSKKSHPPFAPCFFPPPRLLKQEL